MVHEVFTEYKINKEKRTIVCIITTINDVLFKLKKYNIHCRPSFNNMEVKKYVGKAICSTEDEWDESFGRKLANYRASKARQKDVNTQIYKKIKDNLNNIENILQYGLIKNPNNPLEKLLQED